MRTIDSRLTIAPTLICCLLTAGAVSATSTDNWPQFRGPSMNAAVADNPSLPDRWSQTQNVEWVTEIPPLGWSSPVVWGNRVFLTTATSEGDFEQPKPGLYAPRGRAEPPQSKHDWRVYCLDLETGEVLWWRSVKNDVPEFPRHQKNTYASETPATDGERVYVRFGELGLFVFDMEGNEVWRQLIPHKRTMSDWGSASSPVVHGDSLIVVYDNEDESFIAAYDKRNGNERWRVARDEPSTWATPYVWETDKRTEIVVPGRNKIRSYDLDGKVLWSMDGRMSWATIATPFSSHDMVFVSSGYFQDSHKPVYAIRQGATGDVTLAEGETESEHVAWYLPRAGNYNTSPLVYGNIYYSLLDRGFFEAYGVETGEVVYPRRRVAPRGGASFTASPWAYNGKIFALSEQGDTYVIKAGPEFEVLHVNSLDEMAMASPAIVGDRVLIRTRSRLYSIKQGASLDSSSPTPTAAADAGVQESATAPAPASSSIVFQPVGVTGHSWGAIVGAEVPVDTWITGARGLCGDEELCVINLFDDPALVTHESPVPAANLPALKWRFTLRHGEKPRIIVEEMRPEPGEEPRRLTFDE